MRAAVVKVDLPSIQRAWVSLDRVAKIRPIRTVRDYNRTVRLMNALLDEVGDDTSHPLSSLLDLISEMVQDYDEQQFSISPTSPREVLRFLMETRGFKQKDLCELVAQSNLSAILAGKRKISASLAAKLGRFFKINPGVFV